MTTVKLSGVIVRNEGGKKPGKAWTNVAMRALFKACTPFVKVMLSARCLRGTLISPCIPIVSKYKEIIQLSSATNRNIWEWD